MKHKIFLCTLLVFTYAFLFAQKAITLNPNFHTFLGVDVDNTSIRTNGLFINGVYKGYGAEKAGIQRGDSLMMINSTSLHNFNELVRVLDLYQPGDNIDLTIVRNHRPQKLSATVSAYPEFLKYNSLYWVKDLTKNGFEGEIKRAKLGIDVEPVWDKYAVKVTAVIDSSAAAKAGVETGDIILKMDNYQFATMEELRYYLSKYKPGDVVMLTVLHEGEMKSLSVKLDEEVIYLNNEKDKLKLKEKS